MNLFVTGVTEIIAKLRETVTFTIIHHLHPVTRCIMKKSIGRYSE